MSNRMPVTRSLHMIDRVLSFLLLAMGLIMVYLTLTSGSIMLALASLIFLTVGFVKIRDLIPVAFRTIRKTVRPEPLAYKQILLPVSRPEAAESMVKMASDVLSPGGKARTHQRHRGAAAASGGGRGEERTSARALLKEATGFADKLGIESRAEIVSARTATEAILDRAREYQIRSHHHGLQPAHGHGKDDLRQRGRCRAPAGPL